MQNSHHKGKKKFAPVLISLMAVSISVSSSCFGRTGTTQLENEKQSDMVRNDNAKRDALPRSIQLFVEAIERCNGQIHLLLAVTRVAQCSTAAAALKSSGSRQQCIGIVKYKRGGMG